MRLLLALLLLIAVAAGPVYAEQDVPTLIDEAAVEYGVAPAYLERVAWCESRFDPSAVGAAGEIGLFQLHPYGLLPLFYERGFDDPWDAAQQATFAAWAFASGLAGHWTCARGGY